MLLQRPSSESSRRASRASPFVAALLCTLPASQLRATETEAGAARGEQPCRAVLLQADGARRASYQAMASALRGQLSDLPVCLEVRWTRSTSESDVFAVVSYDLERPDRVAVVDQASGRDLTASRRIREERSVGRSEAVALIVRSAISALLSASQGSTAKPPAAPAPAPATSVAPARVDPAKSSSGDRARTADSLETKVSGARETHGALAFDARCLVDAQSRAEPFVQSLFVAAAARLSRRVSAHVGYRFVLDPPQAESEGVRLRLLHHPVSLGAAVDLPGARLQRRVALSGVLDTVSRRVVTSADGASPRPADLELRLALRPSASLGVGIARWLELYAVLGAEVPLGSTSYVAVRSDGTKIELLRPWPVQPYVGLGARVAAP